jgi:hypothetical protein
VVKRSGYFAACLELPYCSAQALSALATVATLPSALVVSDLSLGASWVFSFQPVLPPV